MGTNDGLNLWQRLFGLIRRGLSFFIVGLEKKEPVDSRIDAARRMDNSDVNAGVDTYGEVEALAKKINGELTDVEDAISQLTQQQEEALRREHDAKAGSTEQKRATADAASIADSIANMEGLQKELQAQVTEEFGSVEAMGASVLGMDRQRISHQVRGNVAMIMSRLNIVNRAMVEKKKAFMGIGQNNSSEKILTEVEEQVTDERNSLSAKDHILNRMLEQRGQSINQTTSTRRGKEIMDQARERLGYTTAQPAATQDETKSTTAQ